MHPTVEAWRRVGEGTSGPVKLAPPRVSLSRTLSPRSLVKGAPTSESPLVLLAELDGTPLILHTRTGQVVSLHGDATLREVALQFEGASDASEFADALADAGAGITFEQLLSLAAAVRTWKSWRPREVSAAERTRVIAKGLGLTAKKLMAAASKRPAVFEWLGPLTDVEPAALCAPPKTAPPKLEVIETLPRSWSALEGKAAVDLKPVLPASMVPQLAKLSALRHLCVRLPHGSTLPVLEGLESLTVWNGAIPPMPKLEQLTAWSVTTLPKSMPAIKVVSLSVGDARLGPLLKTVSGWKTLELLVVTNAWPKPPRLPPEFKLLSKVKSLQRVRLANTAFAGDTKGLVALQRALRPRVLEVL